MDLKPLESTLRRLAQDRADPVAWDNLYHNLWPFVFASTYRTLTRNPDWAKETAQEVMLRIFEHADFSTPDLKPERFLGYVRKVCRSASTDAFRRMNGEIALSSLPFERIPAAVAHAEQAQIGRDQVDLILHDLTPFEREVSHHLLDGKKPAEIASLLKLDTDKIYYITSRIRRSVRKHLKMVTQNKFTRP